MSFKTNGFTLIEVLVTIVIFTIVLVASGQVLSTMLKLQAEANVQMIVVDVLQSRLQEATIVAVGTNVCDGVDLTTISIKDADFYVACVKDKLEKDDVVIEWPVLGASATSASQAENCASGLSTDNCFVVGR